VYQRYDVPSPDELEAHTCTRGEHANEEYLDLSTMDTRHVTAVYSMWQYFLDFCASEVGSCASNKASRQLQPLDPLSPYSTHSHALRLKVFQELSQGKQITSQECHNQTISLHQLEPQAEDAIIETDKDNNNDSHVTFLHINKPLGPEVTVAAYATSSPRTPKESLSTQRSSLSTILRAMARH